MSTAVRARPMTYGDFSVDDLKRLFGLNVCPQPLFGDVERLTPAPWLVESIRRGTAQALLNEKSRSEFIVSPILLHCGDHLDERFSVYSGVSLDVDPEQGLRGACDFLLARNPPIPALQAPVLVVVKAKRGDIEAGVPQCGAEMIAARLFNERHDRPVRRMHGCVTTGEDWQFLRLDEQNLWIDRDRYYLPDLGKILGILVAIMKGADTP